MPVPWPRWQYLENHTFVRPLIPITVALMLGIGLGLVWPGCLATALAVVLALSSVMLLAIAKRRRLLVAPLLFFVAIGYLSIQPWLRRQWPSEDISHYTDQGQWQVSGAVVQTPERSPGQIRFILEVHTLTQDQRHLPVHGKITLTVRGETDLGRGDEITVNGHLRDIHGFCNPGGFDYERYLALQGIHARLYAQGDEIQLTSHAGGWLSGMDRLRRQVEGRMTIALQNHPPASAQVLSALTVGLRDSLPDTLNDAYSRAGVMHLLSISGLHIGMVATAAFALLNLVLVWIPFLRQRAWVRKTAALLSLLPVLSYGLLAGMSPATQRSLIMVSAYLMTFWIGRNHDWLNALAVAALVVLTIHPPALMDVSFQLSFGAVLAILLGMRAMPILAPVAGESFRRRWTRRLAASVGVSVFATLGTAPLVLTYFNQISWIGLLTNLVVVPLTGILVVPAGLLGIALLPVGELPAHACWQAAAWGVDFMNGFIQQLAQWPYGVFIGLAPSWIETILSYFLMTTLLLYRRPKLFRVGLTLVLVAAAADTLYWVQRRFDHGHMIVTAVDIGQGSANILQLPGGYTAVVDGGGFGDNSSFDVGKNVLAPLLWRNKIRTIDLMILTHPNSDHLNGLLFIVKHFKVGRIWSNHEPEESQGYNQWLQTISQKNLLHEPFESMVKKEVLGEVTFEILGPPQDFKSLRPQEPWRDLNNDSLVTKVSWKEISFLFTGDITAPAEADLLQRHTAQELQSTFLFVPHHGSKSSSTPNFLSAVQPREALISAGWKNRFHFPHPKVLHYLQDAGARLWRTDQCGAIQITTDGRDYHIETCREPGRTP
ncbi:MAG: DNA internalization-related competence protein ComEC/Rec2 [Desulfobacteraceae bacterium]|nr:DNA internalization-related competence protein ComEC/Rec2 [Desulfobacteraceae bacterium]